MSAPLSPNLAIQPIPNAGRGVLATHPIRAGEILHASGRPAAHLVFREYRKEVCASCFHYDRGRTLGFRDTRHGTGKVFCSEACWDDWAGEQGELGIRAWKALEEFVRGKRKGVAIEGNALARPGREEIGEAWERAERERRELEGRKKGRRGKRVEWNSAEPDVLSFLLSGVLFHFRYPERWGEVLELAMDERPYRSGGELEAFCVAYQQLASVIVSPELLSSVTFSVCRTVVSAAGHNAFGIRSDDNEEYMGYGVYPSASYFNHSCSPNVGKKRQGWQWVFTALRDVDVGEECCITYMGGDEKEMNVKERQARSEEVWEFTCRCQRCIDEESNS